MYTQKTIAIILLSLYTLPYAWVFAAPEIPTLSCEYDGQFQECMQANQWGNPRSIEDFICLQSQDQAKVLDQIILDAKFREIDDKVEELLDAYKNDKESSVTDLNRNIDDITKMLWIEWVFYKEFSALCNGWLLAERVSCTEKISNTEAGIRIRGSSQNQGCIELVKNKLDIYYRVAADIQKINKSEVLRDERQEYVQEERTKYDALLQLMLDIIWFLERLYSGLTHFTPNPR